MNSPALLPDDRIPVKVLTVLTHAVQLVPHSPVVHTLAAAVYVGAFGELVLLLGFLGSGHSCAFSTGVLWKLAERLNGASRCRRE